MKTLVSTLCGVAFIGLGFGLPAAAKVSSLSLEPLSTSNRIVEREDGVPRPNHHKTFVRPLEERDDASILLWSDPGDSFVAAQALELLQLPYVEVEDAELVSALEEGTFDVLIIDKPNYRMDSTTEVAAAEFIASGGRAMVSYWDLDIAYTLSEALQISIVTDLLIPPTFTKTTPLHPIWKAAEGLPGRYAAADSVYNDDGDVLAPLTGATSIAVSASGPSIVVGNENRTVVNGFLLEDYSRDSDVDGIADIVELAASEIAFVVGR